MAFCFSAESRDHFARSFNSKKMLASDNWLTHIPLHRVVFMEDANDSRLPTSWRGFYGNANIVESSFPQARLANVISLSKPPITYWAELWRGHSFWHILHVSPHCFIIRLVKCMQLRLEPRNVTFGLSIVHSELDFVYFMAQIP